MIFEYVPISTFVLTLALIIYSIFVRRITELTVVLFACVILEMVHEAIKLYLMGFFDGGLSMHLLNFAWYVSFALTDILIIPVIFKLSQFFKVTNGWLTRLISVYFAIMATIQIIRYIDRSLIGTNLLGSAYQVSVVALNSLSACLLIGYVLVEAVNYFKESKQDSNLY